MAASMTAQRPSAPPPAKTPQGAAKMAKMFLDAKGVPQSSPTAVPVDENDQRTAHVLHQCPYLRTVNGGGKERCTTREWLLPERERPFCPQHGKQLEPEQSGPSVFERIGRESLRLHGRSALPWLVPAGAGIADLALHVAEVGALQTGLAAPILAAGGYGVAKYALTARAVERKRIEKGQKTGRRMAALKAQARRYAWYGGEAGLWAAALAGTDVFHLPGLIVAGLGMTRWAIASRTWWMSAEQRRTRAPEMSVTVDVKAVAEQAPVRTPDRIELNAVTTWATRIGNAGGPLAGTKLVDFKRLPNCEVGKNERTLLPNWSAKVVAVEDGSINMREPRPYLLGRIAAAFKVTYADVSFSADEADLSTAYVRVQPDNPLAETRMWTGPTSTNWTTGTSVIGRFDDGRPIEYQWADEGGACHDLIGGSTGSGKSEGVAQLILTSLHSNGLVLDWVGDPQRGQSYGALKDEVDWFGRDKAEIKLMLLAAVKEMYRRNDVLSKNNIKTWTFAVAKKLAMPLLVITLDEVQNYIDDPDILALVEDLAGMARKCGIKLRLITQIIAAYNLGGSTYIKDQAKSGQTLTFRSETDIAGRSAVEGDSPIDPTQLPRKWGPNTCAAGKKSAGLVFIQGVHGRDVYGRTDYTGEDMGRWLVDPLGVPSVSPGVFSLEAQQESGVLWGDRKERAIRLLQAGRSDAEILPGGRALELIEQASVTWTALNPDGSEPSPSPVARPADSARGKVLAACRAVADEQGVARKAAIVAYVKGEVAETTVTSVLTDLVGEGAVTRVRNGQYEVPGTARAQQLPLEVPAS